VKQEVAAVSTNVRMLVSEASNRTEADYDALVERGRMARTHLDRAQWELGDLATEVVIRYRLESLQRYAQAVAVDYRTLCNYRRVARRYEFSRRRENLTWSHHERALKLTPADADKLLRQAETEGWSVRRLEAKVEARLITLEWEAKHHDGDEVPNSLATTVALTFHGRPGAWDDDIAATAQLVEAIQALAALRLTPSEVVNLVTAEQGVVLDQHLNEVRCWLDDFSDAWRDRWGA